MKRSILALALGLLAAAAPAAAQSPGRHRLADCVDITVPRVTLEGRLSLHVFPGPPNYQDVRAGDAAERTLILTLARDICLDDGGQQADPNERFRVVQVYANSPALRRQLRAGLGRRIRIVGEGFAAHTGHHHAPLVMEVRRVALLPARSR